MAQNAGPVKQVTIAGRIFVTDASVDTTRDLGGNIVNKLMNGDGKTARTSSEPKMWTAGGIGVVIDDAKGDQEFIQAIRDAKLDVAISITYVDDGVYSGVGMPVGESSYSTQSATEVMDLAGAGALARQ